MQATEGVQETNGHALIDPKTESFVCKPGRFTITNLKSENQENVFPSRSSELQPEIIRTHQSILKRNGRLVREHDQSGRWQRIFWPCWFWKTGQRGELIFPWKRRKLSSSLILYLRLSTFPPLWSSFLNLMASFILVFWKQQTHPPFFKAISAVLSRPL